MGTQHTVLSNDMQFAFTSALLDQLEDVAPMSESIIED